MKKYFALNALIIWVFIISGCGNKGIVSTATSTLPVTTASSSATSSAPKDTTEALMNRDYAPPGYDVFMLAEGDIDGDNLKDAAVIFKSKDEDNDTDATRSNFPPRILRILFQNKNGGYTIKAESDKAVMCKTCGGVFGEPVSNLLVHDYGGNGVVEVSHYGGSRLRWGYTHKFRWQKNGLYLIGETLYYLDDVLLADETRDYNLVTGDYEHTWNVPDDYETNPELSESEIAEIKKYDREPERTKVLVRPLIKLENFDINEDIQHL